MPTRMPRSSPGQPPVIGIVGAGAVGTALGVALSRAGWPVHAVASRDAGRRERFRQLVEGSCGFAEAANALLEEVELIVLAVPDDALPKVSWQPPPLRSPGPRPHQRRPGRQGSSRQRWPPGRRSAPSIRSWRSPTPSAPRAALRGATVAIEGDDQLARPPGRHGRGGRRPAGPPGAAAPRPPTGPLRRPGGRRTVALLDAIAELGSMAGLDEAGSLAIYGAAHRADPGERPSTRDPVRPDRPDHPRRPRHP